MTDKFLVSAILVSHDGATWIPEVIAALNNQSRPVDRIVAVDTGSKDASTTFLRNSGVTVLETSRDVGFGSAIDQGLTLLPINQLHEEWLWFIHDDCAPALDALEKLLAAVEDRPNVAIAGPKLRGWYDRNHLLEVGITIAGNGSRWTGLERGEQDQGQHDGNNSEVLSVSTAAMLAKRSVFESIGGFDPNLELFRDDVDLGWRAHVAGFSVICVTNAVAFHAEAAANERRAVDVSEAFFHRPLLLDRRNAAYVLLANSSWWMLPWIAVQLIFSSALRAVVNLLAKLPGYAADELAAVVLLLIKPADLIQARKERKSHRMLSARVVGRFIPPRSQQFRATFERISNLLLAGLTARSSEKANIEGEGDVLPSYSDIGVIDENFDDPELLTIKKHPWWRFLRTKPLLLSLLLIIVLTSVASRSRYGLISGGALPIAPGGAMDLIRSYLESWHQVGLGSPLTSPVWIAILGMASALTFGNLVFFIAFLFWATPVLALFTAYRAFKIFGINKTNSLIGGWIYALSPVVWGSLRQGRLATIVIAILAPLLLSAIPLRRNLSGFSWRRIYSTTILAAILAAFSPLFLIGWSAFHIIQAIRSFGITADISKPDESRPKAALDKIEMWLTPTVKRRLAFIVLPWVVTFPWSASLLRHPTKFLLEPGLPFFGGDRWSILLLNPGGRSAMPLWLIAPGIFLLFLALIHSNSREWGVVGVILLSIAVFLSSVIVSGHGSSANVWVGSLLVFVQLCGLIPILKSADQLLPNLRSSQFGVGHVTTAIFTSLCLISIAAASVWIIATGGNSVARAGAPEVIPAFVASLDQTDSRPKTLVIRKSSGQIQFFISRGLDLGLGDPDVVVPPPDVVQSAVNDMISGVGVTSSKQLGENGIQYIFMKNPVDGTAVRTIDGLGGFTRSSATKDGIIWKVVGASPRVLFTDLKGNKVEVPSSGIGAVGKLSGAGTITLAENYDQKWRLISNGMSIPLQRSPTGLPTFTITAAGDISLSHDGTLHRGLLSIQLIALLVIVVLALPAGRRRREVPIEELV
jgi:GT2 family glycosyltransferase